MTWREIAEDQRLRLVQKMLEQQGQLNDAKHRMKGQLNDAMHCMEDLESRLVVAEGKLKEVRQIWMLGSCGHCDTLSLLREVFDDVR